MKGGVKERLCVRPKGRRASVMIRCFTIRRRERPSHRCLRRKRTGSATAVGHYGKSGKNSIRCSHGSGVTCEKKGWAVQEHPGNENRPRFPPWDKDGQGFFVDIMRTMVLMSSVQNVLVAGRSLEEVSRYGTKQSRHYRPWCGFSRWFG